jgi:hypothetical protein
MRTPRGLQLRTCLVAALGAGLVAGLAGPARAQLTATVELEAPAGHPGAGVRAVSFFTGGDGGTLVGQWSGLLFSIGSVARASFAVAAPPDAMRVTFEVPFAGASTVLVVDPLSFPDAFFLPDPSPGGVIGPFAGDASDAVVRVSLAEAVGDPDATPPDCEIVRVGDAIEARVEDDESGLASLELGHLSNVSASLPAFLVGTTDPVVIEASVIDPEQTATILVEARDVAGNLRVCKRVSSGSSGGGGLAGGEGEEPLSAASAPTLAPLGLGALALALAGLGGLALSRRRG